MERRGMSRSFAPVRAGEELDVRIEAVGEKGDGIAKVKGFVLFVPGVKEGDEVKVRIGKVLRKVGFAEVIGQPSGPIPQEAPRPPKAPSEGAGPDKKQSEEEGYSEEAEPEASSEDSEDFGDEEQ